MKAEIYWVETDTPGRLAIMPKPRGGDWLEDDIRSLREDGVDVLLSLLESHETDELGLIEEPRLCREVGIDYVSFPIPDRGVPESTEDVKSLIRALADHLQNGKGVAIHCRAGIGRSAVIVGAVLLETGMALEDALQRLSRTRGFPVPETEGQRGWLEQFQNSSGT